MLFGLKLDDRKQAARMALFFAGFFCGIAAVCFFSRPLVIDPDFLDLSSLSRLKQLEVDQGKLFVYSVRQRLGVVLFLVLVSVAGLGGLGGGAFLVWCGASSGIVLTALSMRYGIRGVLFFLGATLPQQLFLAPGFWMLLDWRWKQKGARRLFASLLFLLAGCLLESYVNPILLRLTLSLL